MIHELRTYTLQPGKQGEYLKLSGDVGRKARGNKYGTLEGHWYSEFGTLNQVVHLWSYPDLNERDRLRGELAKNDDWTKGYLPQIRGMLMAQENKVLSVQLPLKPPAGEGHVYELRSYRTQVGRAGEWLSLFKGIMPVREKYSKNVCVWQSEMGPLNEVVHMWAYESLDHRAKVRAQVLADPEWQTFLGKATPLLLEMRSVALMPSPHSPMK